MLRWLERRLGWLAIPNVTLFLICGQVLTFFAAAMQPAIAQQIALYPERVLAGEVWRLFTFMVSAPVFDPTRQLGGVTILFFIIQLYLFWIFGRALEVHWGTFRYNLFLLLGYLASVAGSFLVYAVWGGQVPATNGFLYATVFLAFAFLFPDFVIHLYFILPIRIKWLALLAWALYGVSFVLGDWMVRVMVVASVTNWLLFFGRDVLGLLRLRGRKIKRQAQAATQRDEPFHRCVVCGRTDKTDPQLDFRYARTDEGVKCYCVDHVPGGITAGAGAGGGVGGAGAASREPAGRRNR